MNLIRRRLRIEQTTRRRVRFAALAHLARRLQIVSIEMKDSTFIQDI